jgi:hypothetical protein
MTQEAPFEYGPLTGCLYWAVAPKQRPDLLGDLAGSLHTQSGYIKLKVAGKSFMAHRWIYEYMTGAVIPKGMFIDHINGNRSDNRWENLRMVDRTGNARNVARYSNNTSGITGVSWFKHCQRWCANIRVDKALINLGYFPDFFEACCARKAAELIHGFHINHGRSQ